MNYDDPLPPEQQLRIGFDAMSLLYTYKSSYEDVYPILRSLKAQGHKLLFVFDGKAPAEKGAEVKERREARAGAAAAATNLKAYLEEAEASGAAATMDRREKQILEFSVARLEYQGWHMSREVRQKVQTELRALEIPYMKGTGEADAVLGDLVAAGKLDVIVSTDMDFLLGVEGAPSRLWIPARRGGNGFEEIVLAEVLEGEGLTRDSLRDAGLLCGVEPLRGQPTVTPQTAFSWLRYYRSLEGVLGSSIQEPALAALREAGERERVRAHFAPAVAWWERIRPDHLREVAGAIASFGGAELPQAIFDALLVEELPAAVEQVE